MARTAHCHLLRRVRFHTGHPTHGRTANVFSDLVGTDKCDKIAPMKKSRSASLLLLLTTIACHPKPTEDLVLGAVQTQANCVEPPQILASEIHIDGDYAAGPVDAYCIQSKDDATLGRSCRNITGCYKKVPIVERCNVRFQWKAGWVLEHSACGPILTDYIMVLVEKIAKLNKWKQAIEILNLSINDRAVQEQVKRGARVKRIELLQRMLSDVDNLMRSEKWGDAAATAQFVYYNPDTPTFVKEMAEPKMKQALEKFEEDQKKRGVSAAPEEIPDWLKKQASPAMPSAPSLPTSGSRD